MTKRDIESRADIKIAVDDFYDKVLQSPVIGHIFTDVAQIDLTTHLPRMYDFWETALFGNAVFKGNPMLKHILLSRQTEMNKPQFAAWMQLWEATLDAHFSGPNAESAKKKAASIGGLMMYKIQNDGMNFPGVKN